MGEGSLTAEEAACLKVLWQEGLSNLRNRQKANMVSLKKTKRGEEKEEAGEVGRGQIEHDPVCHNDVGLYLKTTARH